MLTASQQILIEQFANQLVKRVGNAIKNKPVNRTSVRYEKGERIATNFSAPVNSTGKLLRSLYFEITDKQLIIYGDDHAYFLIYGRKPTKQKGTGTLKSRIEDWVRAKGISSNDISEKSLVFLISRKIHREGSSIWIRNKGQNSGLFSNILTKEVLDEFNRKFTAQLISELKEEFGN